MASIDSDNVRISLPPIQKPMALSFVLLFSVVTKLLYQLRQDTTSTGPYTYLLVTSTTG